MGLRGVGSVPQLTHADFLSFVSQTKGVLGISPGVLKNIWLLHRVILSIFSCVISLEPQVKLLFQNQNSNLNKKLIYESMQIMKSLIWLYHE